MPDRILPTIEELHRLFEYRDGVLLWRVKQKSNSRNIGEPAGTKHPDGYCSVFVQRKQYLRHRLIWVMFNGFWPKCLDHIDGDKGNDRIENLREATMSQNLGNTKIRKNNKTGYKGVCLKVKGNYRRYCAQINVNGKVRNLGYFRDPIEAHEAYKKAAIEAFGEFARF